MRRDFNPVRRARPVEGASAGIFTGQVLRTLLGAHHVRPAPFSQAVPLPGLILMLVLHVIPARHVAHHRFGLKEAGASHLTGVAETHDSISIPS